MLQQGALLMLAEDTEILPHVTCFESHLLLLTLLSQALCQNLKNNRSLYHLEPTGTKWLFKFTPCLFLSRVPFVEEQLSTSTATSYPVSASWIPFFHISLR